jgi:hypothetical protein
MFIPPPLLSDDDWPSPPTSSSLFETPVVSHVETFYMEIHPEEACKVLVVDSATDPTGGDGSSTDENHTLQDDDNDFLSGECLSSSATTLDGTVKVAVRPKCPSHYCAGSSLSEDTSMGLSLSEWSSSTSTMRPQCPLHYTDVKSDNTSLDDLRRSVPDIPTSSKMSPYRSRSPSYYSGAKSDTCLDDSSPTRLGKPPSGQKSRTTFYSASKSLTSSSSSFKMNNPFQNLFGSTVSSIITIVIIAIVILVVAVVGFFVVRYLCTHCGKGASSSSSSTNIYEMPRQTEMQSVHE